MTNFKFYYSKVVSNNSTFKTESMDIDFIIISFSMNLPPNLT